MKPFRLTAAILLTCIAAGCHRSAPVPEGVLDQQAYVDLLTDLYLAEGLFAVESDFSYQHLDSSLVSAYDTLLARHRATPETFEISTAYYLQHRELSQQIHEQVMQNLSQDPTAPKP